MNRLNFNRDTGMVSEWIQKARKLAERVPGTKRVAELPVVTSLLLWLSVCLPWYVLREEPRVLTCDCLIVYLRRFNSPIPVRKILFHLERKFPSFPLVSISKTGK